ncbi:hypothetical protein D3C86_1443730 [compost metagenome]
MFFQKDLIAFDESAQSLIANLKFLLFLEDEIYILKPLFRDHLRQLVLEDNLYCLI